MSLLIVILASCTSVKPEKPGSVEEQIASQQPDSSDRVYSVYLIGDAGWASREPRSEVLNSFGRQLRWSGSNSAAVFLGDNVYLDGLPDENHPDYRTYENRLLAQLETVEDYKGRIVFIPGNHDWQSSGTNGLKRVRRQERYVEAYLNRGNTFLPDSGRPGPVHVPLLNSNRTDTLINLLVLDTQWWLHPHEKAGASGQKEEERQKKRIARKFDQLVEEHSEEPLLVIGHHPVYSRSTHGGYFPLKTHLLPPVFGSIYVAYRNLFGDPQDISHRTYAKMKKMMLSAFEGHEVVYASGHDHTLQLLQKERGGASQFYLVSGAGSTVNYVNQPEAPEVGYQGIGFAVLHFYDDGSRWVEFRDERGGLLFEREL